MTTRREDRLQKAEAQADPKIHNGIVEATSHDEAMAEIARRIADGRADPRGGFLIVPPTDDRIEAWEARQTDREKRP